MIRVRHGDYLLPGNDGRTLWRLRSYLDGPSFGLDVRWKRDRTFWQLWRWPYQISNGKDIAASIADDDAFESWVHIEDCIPSRKEAIQSALHEELKGGNDDH